MRTLTDPDQLQALLPTICDAETSMDPEHWSPENPLLGHCAVVSCVAQNLFGGKLLRASLAEYQEFASMGSHYLLELPDGRHADFTAPQFGDRYPAGMKLAPRERAYVLSFPETRRRYALLAFRLAAALSVGNPLFNDDIYRRCMLAAFGSPCKKMGFGCVITRGGEVVYDGSNAVIEPLKSLCDPTCIRLSIPSRTESMLGACGHAEEIGLWDVIHRGIPTQECEVYVAGAAMNGVPYIKTAAEHSCLRCAVQMHHAKVGGVHVPVVDRWERLTMEQALGTAVLYATQQKKP